MKKLIGATIVAFSLFTFAACDDNNEVTTNGTGTNAEAGAQAGTATGTTASDSDVSADAVLATYDGHELLVKDFLVSFNLAKMEEEWFYVQWMGWTPEDIEEHWAAEGPDGQTAIEALRMRVIEEVLENHTLLALAQEAGYTYDPDELDAAMSSIWAEVEQLEEEGNDAHALWYEFYGITIDQYEEVHKNILTRGAFSAGLRESIEVTDAEVLAFYNEDPDAAHARAGFEARTIHILFSAERDDDEAVRAGAEAEAYAVLARIDAGEDASELAALYSDCPSGEGTGGLLEFTAGQMVEEFNDWSFAASYGDTAVIETTFGFHVVKSMGVDTIENNMDEVRNILRQDELEALRLQMIQDANFNWIIDEELLGTIN